MVMLLNSKSHACFLSISICISILSPGTVTAQSAAIPSDDVLIIVTRRYFVKSKCRSAYQLDLWVLGRQFAPTRPAAPYASCTGAHFAIQAGQHVAGVVCLAINHALCHGHAAAIFCHEQGAVRLQAAIGGPIRNTQPAFMNNNLANVALGVVRILLLPWQ